MTLLGMRLLQFFWFTIERCSIVEATWPRVFTLGGRVNHAYSLRLTREATRISLLGAGLCLASLGSSAAQDPTGSEASNNAISGYLGAGLAFGKGLYQPGWRSARSAPSGATTIGELCLARVPISARPSTAMRAMARHFSAIGSALEP